MKSQEDEVLQEASSSVAEYSSAPTPKRKNKPRRPSKKILIILALVLIGAAVAGFLLTKSEKQPPEQPAEQKTEDQAEAPVSIENFVSQDLQLTLSYPSNWKIDDSSQGELKIVSPSTKVKASNGETTDGSVVVHIRSKAVPLTELTSDTTASQSSEKFSYASPSLNQRQETFLSFLAFSNQEAGIDGVYITGDNGYEKGNPISKGDFATVEPIVSVMYFPCKDAECNAGLAFAADELTANKMLIAAKEILRSLIIN